MATDRSEPPAERRWHLAARQGRHETSPAATPFDSLFGIGNLNNPLMDLLDHFWPERPPPVQSLEWRGNPLTLFV